MMGLQYVFFPLSSLGKNITTDATETVPKRVLHFVTTKLTINDVERLLKLGRKAGFNTIIPAVAWKGSVALESMPWVKKQSATWTPSTLHELNELALSLGYEVIPQLPLLTKADKLFQGNRPELLFNRSTYDARNKTVYTVVFSIIDEIIEIMNPTNLHIGHDEVWGWKRKDYERGRLSADEKMLPADIFVKDVHRIHDYLKRRGIGTWMWGDMLVSSEEFPYISAHGSLHRGIEMHGYGKILRKSIPRDIVICDWQYRNTGENFPTMKVFLEDGFSVLGATFKDMAVTERFARYAAMHKASGMIATTWYYAQRKDWVTLERLIMESGRIFVRYFP